MSSSVIKYFRYDAARRRLRIFFRSGFVYDYKNFPEELYKDLRNAFSKGKFLNEQIKGKYPFEKVDVSSS
jgi:KTSC domain